MAKGGGVAYTETGIKGGRVGRYRYVVVSVLWLALLLAAFDRTNVSLLLADPTFLQEMGLEGSPERQGMVMTALLVSYAISNIFLSPTADLLGPRRVLALMAAFWAAACSLMGAVASYPLLLAGRAGRGVAEGPLFPIANRYVRNWFPPSERGGANAIWTSGQRVGLAISVPILATTIAVFGWRYSFFLQAALAALVALPAVWFLAADRPEKAKWVGEAERAHIAAGNRGEAGRGAQGKRNLALLLGNYRYWLAVGYHFAMLAVYFGLITWLPKYLRDARGFDVAQMVLFASLPHLFSTATGLVFGFLSDRFGSRGAVCSIGLSGASVCVLLAALAPDPTTCAVLMVLGFGFWGGGSPAYFAIMQRIVPGPIMATGIGIDNGLSNFGSATAPVAVGFLIGATGSYLAGLLFLAGVGLAGSLAAAILALQRY
ncbi:MAG: MFS transporter [Sphingomonadaceae bacterium]